MSGLWQCRHLVLSRRSHQLAVQGAEWFPTLAARPLCVSAAVRTSAGSTSAPRGLCLLRPASSTPPSPFLPLVSVCGATPSPALGSLPVWTRSLHCSLPRPDEDRERPAQLTQRQRLQLTVRDYGATVIVFHVAISLASLGFFYLAVKSGLDVVAILRWLGLGDTLAQSKVVTGGSTFVLAYAVHKVFAPARIATTLGCTPFIVRYLRQRGLLRTPPPRGD